MQLSKIFAKLLAIDSQIDNLPPDRKAVPAPAEDKVCPEDNPPWPGRPIRDQELMTLYRVMDMGA